MSVTCGFFNSLNGDRKYSAMDMSRLFDGLITDGIYASIGTAMMVTADTGCVVNVGIGRAWFNHTWTYNDSVLPIECPRSDLLLGRIDAIVLEVDTSNAVRWNSIKCIEGVASSNPQRPSMLNTDEVKQYPLCYINRKANNDTITQSNIYNMVGSSECPFVTGVVSKLTTNELVRRWEIEFVEWFENLKIQLTGDVAGNLQYQIDETKDNIQELLDLIAPEYMTNVLYRNEMYVRYDNKLYLCLSPTLVSGPPVNDGVVWQEVTFDVIFRNKQSLLIAPLTQSDVVNTLPTQSGGTITSIIGDIYKRVPLSAAAGFELKNDIFDLYDQITSLKGTVTSLNTKISALEKQNTNLSSEVILLHSSVNAEINKLRSEINDLRVQIK